MSAERREAASSTVEAARRALAARFSAAGLASAALDARLLVGAALGLNLTSLIVSAAQPLTQQQADRIEALAQRRVRGEPVARILGETEFFGLRLRLSRETLVPRADTETVVELALDVLRLGSPRTGNLRILDIGTGSGAILIALLSERSDAFGVGTDLSEGALKTARQNAIALGCASRTGFVACDFAAPLQGPFDLIVSNPPYIRSTEIADLCSEVRDHDPICALDGGADGLTAYRAIVPQALRLLSAGGALVVEAGYDQAATIGGLMAAGGFAVEEPPRMDLGGIPRAVFGRKEPR